MLGIYLVIGAFAGMMAGLLGIGGGLIIIPSLATLFIHHVFIPSADVMQVAVGTSLATVVITGAAALYTHHKHSAVVWPQVWKMLPGLVIGVVIGSIIVQFLPSNFLRYFFGVFLVIMGIRMLMNPHLKETQNELSEKVFRIGTVSIGTLCSILGIAGGVLLVPFLLRCNLDMHKATGTSVACGLGVGVTATFCFMLTGLFSHIHIPGSTGYIYWPAFIGIASASVLFAPFGAMLAHKLPRNWLKKIFALFLLIMAVDLLFL